MKRQQNTYIPLHTSYARVVKYRLRAEALSHDCAQGAHPVGVANALFSQLTIARRAVASEIPSITTQRT